MNLYRLLNKFFIKVIIPVVFSLLTISSIAQVIITNPSTTVKIIDNKKFYIHHVLQGQTLTSIARTYGVKVMDIVAENPGLEGGLKLDQDIRIPYVAGFIPGDPLLKSGNTSNNPLPKKNNEPMVNAVPASPEKPSDQPAKDNKEAIKKATTLKAEPDVLVNKKENEKEQKSFTGKAEVITSNINKEELEKKSERKKNISNTSVNLPSGIPVPENKNGAIITSYEEVTEKVSFSDTLSFQNFCNKKITTYFNDTASLNHFLIKEYFFFTIDRKGQITFIKSEQTEFNKNTRLLTQEDQEKLEKLKFKPAKKKNDLVATRVPIGILLDVKRDSLKIKIKGKKIRVYNKPLFVEYIKPENPYYSLIMDKAGKTENARGKYAVIILNGEYALYDMEVKEYNPFDHKLSDLHRKQVLIITEFKKK